MRYYYEQPIQYYVHREMVHRCDHPLYSSCTLFKEDDKGIAIVQKRFNSKMKIFWYGPIDPWLVDDILNNPGYDELMSKEAKDCTDGLYPTMNVRKVMWKLRMKPLKKDYWEEFDS